MDQATLSYVDDSNVLQSALVDVLGVRGYNDPDEIELFPAIADEAIDGTIETKFTGFRRVITVLAITENDSTTDKFVQSFMVANTRTLLYDGDSVVGTDTNVVPDADNQFENVWLDGFKPGKLWTIKITENIVRQSWPSGAAPTYDEMAYIKTDVVVTGTEVSPQTFTTNSGALATDGSGNPYPVINLATSVPHLSLSSKQGRLVHQVGDFVQVGDNVSFQLALIDMGPNNSSGQNLVDIGIFLEAK